jgi:hypothetical protein
MNPKNRFGTFTFISMCAFSVFSLFAFTSPAQTRQGEGGKLRFSISLGQQKDGNAIDGRLLLIILRTTRKSRVSKSAKT